MHEIQYDNVAPEHFAHYRQLLLSKDLTTLTIWKLREHRIISIETAQTLLQSHKFIIDPAVCKLRQDLKRYTNQNPFTFWKRFLEAPLWLPDLCTWIGNRTRLKSYATKPVLEYGPYLKHSKSLSLSVMIEWLIKILQQCETICETFILVLRALTAIVTGLLNGIKTAIGILTGGIGSILAAVFI